MELDDSHGTLDLVGADGCKRMNDALLGRADRQGSGGNVLSGHVGKDRKAEMDSIGIFQRDQGEFRGAYEGRKVEIVGR